MFKKIILLSILVFNFVFIQMSAFANESYSQRNYLHTLEQKIESNWINPLKPANKGFFAFFTMNNDVPFSNIELQRSSTDSDFDKSVLVSFTISKGGSFSNVKIQRSSNNEDFDKSALTAVCNTASLGQLPDNLASLDVLCFFSPALTSLSTIDKTPLQKNNGIVNVANINSNFDSYEQSLQDKIVSNWNPRSIKKTRNATILVSLNKNGTINDIKIQKSSNKKKFDFEIVDSIMKSVPLGALPANTQSESKNIQLNFFYEKTNDKNAPIKRVVANIKTQDGYDEYIEQVEKIVSKRLKDKKYFCKKDIFLEMNIDKNGKLTYVKVKNASTKDRFIRKEFNRKTLVALQRTSFTPIPDRIGVDNVTINYRILTQRKRLFHNLMTDYLWNFFRTGLESYCVQAPDNI